MIFKRDALLAATTKLIGTVQSRNNLPILGHFLIKEAPGKIELYATDLESSCSITVVNNDLIDNPIQYTINAKSLVALLKKYPKDFDVKIMFQLAREGGSNSDHVKVLCGRSQTILDSLPYVDFPLLHVDKPTIPPIFIDAQKFKSLINSVAHAMAAQDARYYLNGMLLDMTEKELICVATDGHRLGKSVYASLGEPCRALIPRKAVLELQKLLHDTTNAAEVQINLYPGSIEFKIDNVCYLTKLIDGKFPEYERVIPKKLEYMAVVNKEQLAIAIGIVSTMSDERYKGIKLSFSKNGITIEASNVSSDSHKSSETAIDALCDFELVIGVNAEYILDVLKAIDSDDVVIEVNDSNSSMKLTTKNNPNVQYIIMPMRL